ncbi:MAG: hypothetical protein AAGJ38_04320 [Planctomycetota bacterium]
MTRTKKVTERRKISKKKRDELIADVFEARRDLSGLAEVHQLTPDALADWIAEEENQRCLAGLCLLADLQTQLMLSRYRQVAVTELIKQASSGVSGGGNDEAGISVEQSRKACVDLLKADLKRAELGSSLAAASASAADDERSAMQEVASIRAALFGEGEDHVNPQHDNQDNHNK